ncbi:MAG: prepilin-type N-terminal cleavage/methylation domain-containing protein [Candidatus Babeliales bacterium]|nr:prepilin-type N-terminal cleavage/methylation domain-containing protein [Candidatus Babeliales bacterium]
MNATIFPTKYKGFLLIELVIAIGIFSLVALLSLSFYWHIIKLNLENEMKINAINIASSYLEDLQSSKNISQEFIVEQKYKVKIEPIFIKKGQYKKKFVIVKIIVSWDIYEKNKSVSFVTGIII